MNSQIRFVYFDLGNVLVAFDPQIACAGVANLFGVSSDEARSAIYDSGLQTRFEYGEVSSAEFAETVRGQLAGGDGQVSDGRVADDAILDAASAMFQPVESMRPLLDAVRDAGYAIGVLSNTCVAHWDWIARQSYRVMDGHFDVTVLSYEVRSMKPDEEIYCVAERLAQVSAEQILFLDDRSENVAAARQRGWNAEQCLGGPQAKEVLEKHRVIGDHRKELSAE